MRLIGDCYNRMDYTVSAFRYYLNAFRREPENASLAASLSNLLLLLQEPEEAVAVCDTSLRYHPQSRLLLQSKGLALFTMQKYAQADTVYSMLMAQADSSYNTLKYGGSAQYYAGQYMRAIEPLENAYQKIRHPSRSACCSVRRWDVPSTVNGRSNCSTRPKRSCNPHLP